MLKGKEFGQAIGQAITLKLDSGGAASKADIARHFGMKPPSLADWVKKGAVAKEKLPELWRYFSDVVGPEHWGLTKSEWPAGLTPAADLSTGQGVAEAGNRYSVVEWPFGSISPERYALLSAKQKEAIEEWVDDQITRYTGANPDNKRRSGRKTG
jgi:hypothetical protein